MMALWNQFVLQNLTIVNRKTVKILFLSLWNEAKGLIHVKVFNKLGAGSPKHSWLAKGQIKKQTFIYTIFDRNSKANQTNESIDFAISYTDLWLK